MATINLDLVDAFNKQFGYQIEGQDFKFSNTVTGDTTLNSKETGAMGSPYWINDINGRPMYMPITVRYPDPASNNVDAQALLGNGGMGVVKDFPFSGTGVMKTWVLPYCVISAQCKKTIIKTPLTERGGTVKELVNVDDWQFTVEGFLVNRSNEFPEDDFTTLVRLYECNTPIEISSIITDIVLKRPARGGSVHVVIEDLSFPANRGVKHVKPYMMKLCGDGIVNLVQIKK